MSSYRKTLFISDLHLDEYHPEIAERFLKLLKDYIYQIDAIYILGDLFEMWIGDDDLTPFHASIIQALHAATQAGLPIYFMYGNRDFLIGKRFLRETGCQLLADEEKITVYGEAVLLMHGDTLCTNDVAYLRARKKARNRFLQTLFLLLPLSVRRKIAQKMRAASARHTQSTAIHIMDVTEEEVKRVMQKHHVTYLIHGHTHRPGKHEFSLPHGLGTRLVLGAWHENGNAWVWDETGKKEWVEL